MNKGSQKKSTIKYWYRILTISAVVLFLISGCNLLLPAPELPPTPTATQTTTPTPTIDWFPSTPTPTIPPIATQALQPTPENQREGITELLVDDDFTDVRLWTTPQTGSGNVAFGIQNLTLAVANENTSLTSISQHALPTNFYLEVTLQTTLCQPEDQSGIIFLRQTEGNYYQLLVNCAGQYRLELIQSGQNVVIYDWETATQIQLGAPATNRLGLWVYQGQFELYINDTYQFTKQIARNRSGGLGAFARTISGIAMTTRFSDLQIYRLELD
jgi:hypothetical protein